MKVTINQTTGVKYGLTRSLSLMVDSFDYRWPCNYQSLNHVKLTQAWEQDQSLAVLLRFRISFYGIWYFFWWEVCMHSLKEKQLCRCEWTYRSGIHIRLILFHILSHVRECKRRMILSTSTLITSLYIKLQYTMILVVIGWIR